MGEISSFALFLLSGCAHPKLCFFVQNQKWLETLTGEISLSFEIIWFKI
jgi:hypothetical protein